MSVPYYTTFLFDYERAPAIAALRRKISTVCEGQDNKTVQAAVAQLLAWTLVQQMQDALDERDLSDSVANEGLGELSVKALQIVTEEVADFIRLKCEPPDDLAA
jgi:hypothetical protein